MPVQPSPPTRWFGIFAALAICTLCVSSSTSHAADAPPQPANKSIATSVPAATASRVKASPMATPTRSPATNPWPNSRSSSTKRCPTTPTTNAPPTTPQRWPTTSTIPSIRPTPACATSPPASSSRASPSGNIKTQSPISSPASTRPQSGAPSAVSTPHTLTRAHFNEKALKLERTDAEVNFDWGDSSPDPDKLEPKEFSVTLARLGPCPRYGRLRVRRPHRTRRPPLRERQAKPLIDAWVISGDETEHRGELHLLGGRLYPIKLEFSTRQARRQRQRQGQRKKKEFRPDAKTAISLEWKRPNHTLEVIASRSLSPDESPVVFVLQTRFPPDDRSTGYERATSISKSWDEADDRMRARNRRLRRRSSAATVRHHCRRRCQRTHPPQVLRAVRRARLPPPANRRRTKVLHRTTSSNPPRSANRRQTLRPPRA